jgi:hypothetical protein
VRTTTFPIIVPSCVAAAAAVLAMATPAGADVYTGPDQTAQQLRSAHVVVADDAEARNGVDLSRLRVDLGGATHLYVAVLPARALDRTPKITATDIGRVLQDNAAVVVVAVGEHVGAAQGSAAPLRSGDAGRIAADVDSSSQSVQSKLDATIAQVRQDATGGRPASGGGQTQSSGGSGSGGVLGLLAVVLGGIGAVVFFRRRKAARAAQDRREGLRAEADSLYARLSNDVSTLSPGDDAVARQAMVDASERFNAAGALLADRNASEAVLAQAKRTALEGVMAARVARGRLGLDLGPDPMPAPPANAPQVQGAQQVEVDGQSYTGYGQYQPGAGNYFGGGTYQGRYIPGGWYARPFWQTAAISAVAFGGLGYAMGGGFGGFDGERYEGDYDDRGDGDGNGGGWSGGDGGSGDWGGGGGGGGDWGGGDFGGGD